MNKKVLNALLTIIVILIVVIFSVFFYMYIREDGTTASVYDDVSANTEMNFDDIVANSNELDNYDTEKLLPFTGAFPGIDIISVLAEKENIKEFSNEQILRLGFAKVTKEDWVDSYVAEDEPVSISAELLDGYIKDIFGSGVKYEKANFSNKGYSIDRDFTSHTSSYEAVYVPETDTYTINHEAGDGINENYIHLLAPNTSKIKGNVEIELPYVFVVYGDDMVKGEIDGQEVEGFEYIIYAGCDYNTKTFTEELGRFNEFDDLANDEGVVDMVQIIEDIAKKDLSKVKKVTLVYAPNEANTEYILKEIKK